MNICVFDFEMSNLNADFGIILCGVIKPIKGKPVVLRLDDCTGYKQDRCNDHELAVALRDELEKYDIWISYNGKRFDIPFLNARLIAHGERAIEKKKHIDVYWQARYKLKLHSSRLEVVQEFLGLTVKKTQMDGRKWPRALAGYRKDMDYIVRHCILDVQVLQRVYNTMKQFIDVIHK